MLLNPLWKALKMARSGFPAVPGLDDIITLPGNGVDDDKFLGVNAGLWVKQRTSFFDDMNKNGTTGY